MHAVHSKGFPDTVTSGRCCKLEEEDVVNGPTASVCFVEQSVVESDGFGTLKTTYGQRCTPSSSGGGFMSTLAKELGITQGYTPKVGIPPLVFFWPRADVFLLLLGWGKKMSYCVAFSADGATDVTRRYVRDASKHGLDRNRCPEEVLVWITDDIKKMRRENTAKEDRRRLVIEDHREEKELRGYVVQALAAQIGQINLSGQRSPSGEGEKLPERVSGSRAWSEARGEAGNHPSSENERQPREGQ